MQCNLPGVYARSLSLPDHSFFLFGPRSTGKTTWLHQVLPNARWYNLLRQRELIELSRNPDGLSMEVAALPQGHWVVIDEIQKLPGLLDEVHELMFRFQETIKFALSGSSARKLRRMNANMLAGRAIHKEFYPLTGAELGFDFDPDYLLTRGCLPEVHARPKHAVAILETYVEVYLKEEIQQEALVQDIGSFTRFLDIAALMNGQPVNVAALARDAGIARPTVQRYFQTLVDTLVGTWLPAWQPQAKVRESRRPKFYFFDSGVVRALADRLRDRMLPEEKGLLLETLVLHELRSAINTLEVGGRLAYWRSSAGHEVDFVWHRGRTAIGFEVKSGPRWRSEYGKHLKGLLEKGALQRGYGVYLGEHTLQDGPVTVLPLIEWMQRLSCGKLLV